MLSKSAIKLHNGATPINLHENWPHFAVFDLEVAETDVASPTPQTIHIMLDQSGSMDERCADRNTKIDQIKHVTKNILHFLKDRSASISVSSFNNMVSRVFATTTVNEENIDHLVKQVSRIYAAGDTNIGLALQSMKKDGDEERHNIFMTDGDATVGETRASEFLKMVDRTAASNTFIGFGTDHNPEIFLELCNLENNSYYFIDKIEKSGLAYGEILHNILFRCLQNVKITVHNGLIYDWKTNSWVNEIAVGSLASGSKKTFHLVAPNIADVVLILSGDPNVHETFMHKGDADDLMKNYYRQKTQEFLYLAKSQSQSQSLHETIKTGENATPVNRLKLEIAQFTRDMKQFMEANSLTEDPLMKNLCDDMVIVYRTLGTHLGVMYTSARQTFSRIRTFI